ncbi:MAG: D-alanyl-D-alanine carboxypeptidase/D-alanyl-D-alanine-endopeptidase [Planctomycetes bacterium]|nr:D-alanyl-D-alanine carboxypeptidase/D-alanyl-D-alanine-endopeptidase [Planctomycetota bacterium]
MESKTKKLLFAVLITICIFGSANADLTNQIDSIIRRPSQKKTEFSVHVINADSGKTVYSRNATKPFVPASNMKIITSAAAVKYLGADFKYETKIGLINDTLVIIGSGDPLFNNKLDDIAAALKQQNITAIKDIVIDTSIFDDQRINPSWPKKELNRHYACEVSGLNYNSNCVSVAATTVKGKVRLAVEPQTQYLKIINKCKSTSKPPNTVWCARPPNSNTITVFGKCYKKCKPIQVAINRPAAFFAFLLAEKLAAAGITVEGDFIERKIDNRKKIKVLRTYTTNLSDVLARCNKNSFGLAAESLLKTIAAEAGQGSWDKARDIIGKYLTELGISEDQFYIDDGSGLSKTNKLSTTAITKVLQDVYKSKNWPLYKNSLAIGGIDGTIGKYFKEQKYKGRILGKTGYVNSVKSFSGVCSTKNGDYIFSIITHRTNGKTRTAINDIAKAIIDSH